MASSSVHLIEYTSGEDRTAASTRGVFTISLYDAAGAAVSLTGATHTLTAIVEAYPGATNEATTGITLTGTATGATLAIANTCALTPGDYLLTIKDLVNEDPDPDTVTCYPLDGPLILRIKPGRV